MINSVPVYFFYPAKLKGHIDYKSGLDCWVLKTFNKLKEYNKHIDIYLVSHIPSEGIIIFHKGYFERELVPTNKQLFVCVQADYGRHRFAQCHIVQNPSGVTNFGFSKRSFFEEKIFSFTKNYFIPHWNQDNIIKRNATRCEKFLNVFYFGISENLPSDLLTSRFKDSLKQEGVNFKIRTDAFFWNNYSEADCVLAIRDFENKPHYNKPFSKIVNSYLAGVPVISGNESSALYLNRKIGIEFKIVRSVQECYEALIYTKLNYPAVLQKVLDEREKMKPFFDNAILLNWENLLERLQHNYFLWRNCNMLSRNLFFKFRE